MKQLIVFLGWATTFSVAMSSVSVRETIAWGVCGIAVCLLGLSLENKKKERE